MLTELFTAAVVISVVKAFGDSGKTHVKHGRGINPFIKVGSRGVGFGVTRRYTEVNGPCYSCNETGKVYNHTCRKCGGSGRYHRKTWHD